MSLQADAKRPLCGFGKRTVLASTIATVKILLGEGWLV
jgi:hypothetical protein